MGGAGERRALENGGRWSMVVTERELSLPPASGIVGFSPCLLWSAVRGLDATR